MNRNYNNNNQYNLKPEAVLEQAIALDGVGKASDALSVMKPIFVGRNTKPIQRPWTQPLEDVTLKYVELAIKAKLPTSDVRNALNAFRFSCINSNAATTQHPQSLIRVIKYLLTCAEKTVNFHALNVSENDNDDEDSPDFFAKFVEAEANTSSTANVQEQQRKNRAMSALRTYWEFYRIALDIIRPHPRSQTASATPPPAYYPLFRQLYEDIVRQAFENCGTYRLPGDFRRLTWRLRTLDSRLAVTTLPEMIDRRETFQTNLNSTLPHDYDQANEQYQHILETKFAQLNVAITLQNWAETSAAFSEITDILTTIDDARVLTSPTVILIQQRFLDFLWDGSNAFLHASALKTLYDRLIQAQRLFGAENPNYIDELLKQTQAKATELGFPTTSWAFAPFTAVQNGLILSVILAQGTSSETAPIANGQQQGGRLFGGISYSPVDYPFSPQNASSYYVTSNSEFSLQGLFAHATGVAAANNHALTATKTNFSIDPSFVPTTQTTSNNIEIFKYIALLSYTADADPTVAGLMAFVKDFSTTVSPTTTTSQILQLFTHLTNKTLTPLRLNRLITPHLKLIKEDQILAQYERPLYTTVVCTVLSALSNIYSVLTFAKFQTLLPPSPFPAENAKLELEAIITSTSVQNNLSVVIDQGSETLHLHPFPQQVEQRLFSILGSTTAAFANIIKPVLDPQTAMAEESLGQFFDALRPSVQKDVERIRTRHTVHIQKQKSKEDEAKAQAQRAEVEAKERAENLRREQERKLEEIKLKREQDLQSKLEEEAKAAKLKQIQDLVTKNAKEAEAKNVVLTKDMKRQLAKIGSAAPGAEVSESDLVALAKKVELQKKREFIRLRSEQKKTVDYTVRALRTAQRESLLASRAAQVEEMEKKQAAQFAAEQAAHQASWEKLSSGQARTAHIVDARSAYKANIMAQRREQWEQNMAAWQQQQEELAAEQRRAEAERKAREETLAEERKAREQQERAEKEAAENEKRANFRQTGEGYRDAKPNKFLSSGSNDGGAKASKFSSAASSANKWSQDLINKARNGQ